MGIVSIAGAKSSKEKLTVKVTDTNPNSSTYGKTATASYKNFKAADLSKDLSAGSYGMFVGEEEKLLYLLGKVAFYILHVLIAPQKVVVSSLAIAFL